MDKKRAKTRKAVIKAATYLFNKYGYEETSMENIASRAEIAAGTLYNYYSSKSILLIAIFGDMTQKIINKLPARNDGPVTEKKALADLTEILQLVTLKTALFSKSIMRQVLAQLFILNIEDTAKLVAMDMQIVAILLPILTDMRKANLLTKDTDLETAAILLFGSAMVQYQAFISIEEMSAIMLNEAIAAQAQIILFGIIKR
ncbi:MAG: TetR/AcrR family transcriptional regulator [Rhizobiales bacterium]|nr:TetR/AcrR family transcriptional regulator [Hyphomicrobiales bacterium]